jgi:hypothetical protein
MFNRAAKSFDAVSQKAWTFIVGGCFVVVAVGIIPMRKFTPYSAPVR